MRLFIDEDLSPTLVALAHDLGFDATSSRDRNMLGSTDRTIADLCFDEDRVLVTNNTRHFLALYARREVHPGLLLLPAVPRAEQRRLLANVSERVSHMARGSGIDARTFMVNRVVEIDVEGHVDAYVFPVP